MIGRNACLKAVMVVREGKSCWSGEYACSICGMRFLPNPTDAAKLTREFAEHGASEHREETR